MSTRGSGVVSRRESIVTLVGCALLGVEAVSNLVVLVFVILLGMVWLPYVVPVALGLIVVG